EFYGTQHLMAEALGVSQQWVSDMVKNAYRITAERADYIHKRSDGRIRRHVLRPDIFLPPDKAV
ncbi:MAG: helix-turn-helix domain-containing protein, partial [Rhodospirillales bacterium]|nr:helix-turn-helix domain-containing protein [Rhodospirillales bacterium]